MIRRLAVLVVVVLAGCGDDSAATDAGGRDSGRAGRDAGADPDTGTRRDSGEMGDSGSRMDATLPEGCEGGPLELPIDGCRPPVMPSTGDPAQDCVNRINQLRWECQCLPPLERWNEGESCADEHAEYDSTRSAHAGFRDRICDNGGRGQNECPGWRSVDQAVDGCLQQMWDEGPGEPFSAHGHYINMTNPAHSRVACGFYTTSDGRVWAVQNFQ